MFASLITGILIPQTPEIRELRGWKVHIQPALLTQAKPATDKALRLLDFQLKEIVEKVPGPALSKLRKVALWMSPEFPGTGPGAAYHPSREWLKNNRRNPAMARSVEFTNIRIFEEETKRMPNFALHELAHAFHDQFLPGGFSHPGIVAAYERAKASGTYDRVERRNADGSTAMDRHYGMSNPMEYFAEATEAYFSRNDFFPYDNRQLRDHDAQMHRLIGVLWGTAR
jgi:dipeptidyl-peptidase-4